MNDEVIVTPVPSEANIVLLDEKGMAMLDRKFGPIIFRKLDGEWIEFDYPLVKGKVEQYGQYKIVLNGNEFILHNIKHTNRGHEYSSKELTKILKEDFLYFVEIDQHTVAAMPNERKIEREINRNSYGLYSDLEYCNKILHTIDSKEAKDFMSLWEYDEGINSIDDNLFLDKKIRVKNEVCGYPFMAIIPNRKRIEWKKAVETICCRYNLYRCDQQNYKSDHQLMLYVLLDLAIKDNLEYKRSDKKENIGLMVYDETIVVAVNEKYFDLLIKGAKYVTERYNVYQKRYSGVYDEAIISRMVLLDLGMNKFEYNNKSKLSNYEKSIIEFCSDGDSVNCYGTSVKSCNGTEHEPFGRTANC